MQAEGMISREDALDGMSQPVGLEPRNLTASSARHFVHDALIKRPDGGRTFLDAQLQSEIGRLAKKRAVSLPVGTDVAVAVIEIETGGLVAMLGGRKPENKLLRPGPFRGQSS